MQPIHAACAQLNNQQVAEGLNALNRYALATSFNEAAERIAADAGVSVGLVYGALPMDDTESRGNAISACKALDDARIERITLAFRRP